MDEAQALLDNYEYEAALKIAEQLERVRYSGAFDIGAQALAGLGRMADAIAMLERGVVVGPQAWPNWELLGNYRSDAGMYESAALAYETALQCENVWADSIRLNQAILAERDGDFDRALSLVEIIEDAEFEIAKTSVKASILLKTDQPVAAISQCDEVSHEDEPKDSNLPYLASLCATRARALLQLDEPVADIRQFLRGALDAYPDSEELLTCFRELRNEPSLTGGIYDVVISFEVDVHTQHELGVLGFVRSGHAIADTPEEAIALFCELEIDFPLAFDGEPEIELVDEEEHALKGVIHRSDKGYYSSRD